MDMPLNKAESVKLATWLETNFGENIRKAVKDSPFSSDMIKAIALQETGAEIFNWIYEKTAAEILGLCVTDPSGDEPNTIRSAFPKNAAALKARYGSIITNMLIAEGNKYRAARGWSKRQWVFKAYGLFCYDIQAITTDQTFFTEKKWYNIDDCLSRLMGELNEKYEIKKAIWPAITAYNGGGQAAREYAQNVKTFTEYIV